MGLELVLETVVEAGATWTIAVNRNQNLLGKTMVVLNRPCTALAEVEETEWADLLDHIRLLTRALSSLFSPDQFNFAFLMNQDAQVHLHVIPRYAGPRQWEDLSFEDPHWGGSFGYEQRLLSTEQLAALAQSLRAALQAAEGPTPGSGWARGWQASWDRLEEALAPDREWLFAGLVELVEAIAGAEPTVVDLACGTGTVTLRLLERLAGASVTALDVDPVLLAIAQATFAADPRVRVVSADLRTADWALPLGGGGLDAVVSATALHWLTEPVVRRLYQDLARLIRPGGLFAHAEVMPMTEAPRIGDALVGRRRQDRSGTRALWDAWWASAARDPILAAACVAREAVIPSSYPAEEFSPPASWHRGALLEAGFNEAEVVFRSGASAIVAGIR